jgi:valyl-tRNA synthetase
MTSNFSDLPSQYDHAAAQARWYPYWESQGYFHASTDPEDPRETFSMVIPPPNVTGALHLGHALNNTLQDILVRMKRMQGFNVLWLPGTDHAGIATQAVVERRLLEEEKISRHDLGREKLVQRIWTWKEQYEDRILGQLKQMGFSCDWQRLRFTLDPICAKAVRETFFKLFKDNKIYRGKRLVNWDTFLQTAVSDDEVFHDPVKGHFWHFQYPVVPIDEKGPGEPTHVTIATTRPETMLGDTAVAVHPDPAAALAKAETDLREKLAAAPEKERAPLEGQLEAVGERRRTKLAQLVQLRDMAVAGRMLELPLTGRKIPLIVDEWAKPELGSGCVKITPAHDANDYAVWQRNPEIGAINVLNPDGTLGNAVPEKYRGLTVKKARSAVVDDLESAGLLVEIEDRDIDLAHSDRSKTPIEPYLADQWFVKMDQLAQSAMDAVTDGSVKIIPERYAKGYHDWLAEKRDWPIGRQLWWGHRIPIWEAWCSHAESTSPEVAKKDQQQTNKELLDFLTAAGIDSKDYYIQDVVEPHPWRIRICAATERAGDALNALADFQKRIREFDDNLKTSKRPTSDLADYQSMTIPGFEEASAAARSIRKLKLQPQEQDVLDTWFSSALWPYSTLGWPDSTEELARFYPTDVLITSRDIITLWVARMVLSGLYNMGEVPFSRVYIHPKILDGYGETMSKSKGNGVDPLDVIDKFGTDALRFGIAHLTTETQDVRMPIEFECPHCNTLIKQTKRNRTLPRIECKKCGKPFSTQWAEKEEDRALLRGAAVSEQFELGRNFCNKLWNASRFALMNLEDYQPGPVAEQDLTVEDRWLLSRLSTVTEQTTEALEHFHYADAARTLYHFAWDEFCSFYIEMAKARFGVPEQRETVQRVLAHALDTLLRLLHPMIPFLTEEVWHLLATVAPERGMPNPSLPAESVCIAGWPIANPADQDKVIEEQFAQFQAVLGAIREIRTRQNVPPKENIPFSIHCDRATAKLLEPMRAYFHQMARADGTAWGPEVTAGDLMASVTLAGSGSPIEVHVDISAFIDVKAEQARLEKQRDELARHIGTMEKKLANENFTQRAPAEVVQQQRDKLAEVRGRLVSVRAALKKLGPTFPPSRR